MTFVHIHCHESHPFYITIFNTNTLFHLIHVQMTLVDPHWVRSRPKNVDLGDSVHFSLRYLRRVHYEEKVKKYEIIILSNSSNLYAYPQMM